jgi:hypothetical protein
VGGIPGKRHELRKENGNSENDAPSAIPANGRGPFPRRESPGKTANGEPCDRLPYLAVSTAGVRNASCAGDLPTAKEKTLPLRSGFSRYFLRMNSVSVVTREIANLNS